MTSTTKTSLSPAMRRLAIAVSIVVALLLLYALAGFLALPRIVAHEAEKMSMQTLHRRLTIGAIAFNPFTLKAEIRDAKLFEPDGASTFATFDRLTADVSWLSLRKLAPVVQSLTLSAPSVHLVRDKDGRTNVDDIVRLIAEQPPAEKPAQFSLNNIVLDGGRIELDDRAAGTRERVTDLRLGIPFISSLPADVNITVEPLLSAMVNGTPLHIQGKAKPFADPREAVVDLNLDALDLTRYLAYLPLDRAYRVPSAKLTTRLTATFRQPKDAAPALALDGTATLSSLRIEGPGGKTLLKLPTLAVTLHDAQAFGKRLDVAGVELTGLQADLTRDADGRIDLLGILPSSPAAKTARAGKPAATTSVLAVGDIKLRDAALRFADRQPGAPLQASLDGVDLDLRQLAVDTTTAKTTVGEIASNRGALQVQRGKPEGAAAKANAAAAPAPSSPSSDFSATVRRISLKNWSVRVEDDSQAKPIAATVAPLSLSLQDVSTAPGATSRIDLDATVNKTGRLAANGTASLSPLKLDLTIDARKLDLLPVQPLFAEQVNLRLTRASLSAKGRVALSAGTDGKLAGSYRGGASLDDIVAVDQVNGEEFLRWRTLAVDGIAAELAPMSLAIDDVALKDFFARVIIFPNGRINLQDITRGGGSGARSLTTVAHGDPLAAAAQPGKVLEPMPPKAKAKSAPSKAKENPALPPIAVKRMRFESGRVRFTDNFIQPNYSANLMDLRGTVSGLSSDPSSAARIDLHGEVNRAPLTVSGQVNPLRRDLLLDVKASVHGMELAPLSPYSGRYLGYGIKKGKLSFEVSYDIENRKLTARNNLVLEQLTLGDKVDSPVATNLPVQFALSLLRDRNGVINVNVPISGSLDDPQFSVGGIVLKVIGNVIVKAVSKPFALLGSIFGSGSETLSWVGFESGRPTLLPDAMPTLEALAKALHDRPALTLEIAGRADLQAERDALKRATLDRQVRQAKRKALQADGKPAPSGRIEVLPAEYPDLLKQVYRDADFPKPRNAIGLTKSLPVDEMEKLLLAHIDVGPEDAADLANRRAQEAKDWLLKTGKVPADRLFIVSTKPDDGGEDDGAKKPAARVDFSLR
ncbi:MAG: DUF748 domain-containing protein [Burkholderiaceae bacterium]